MSTTKQPVQPPHPLLPGVQPPEPSPDPAPLGSYYRRNFKRQARWRYGENLIPIEALPLFTPGDDDYTYRAILEGNRPADYKAARILIAAWDGLYSDRHLLVYENCCRRTELWTDGKSLHVVARPYRCKIVVCPYCADVRSAAIAIAIFPWAIEQAYLKLVTWTLKHVDLPVLDIIRGLTRNFRKFRNHVWWKDRCTGCIWFMHFKLDYDTGEWHIHIHALVAGKFIELDELRSEWLRCTGDSFVTDVQPIYDLQSSIHDVARYAASATELNRHDVDRGVELLDAMAKVRSCGCTGSARGTSLCPRKPDTDFEPSYLGDFAYSNKHRRDNPDAKHLMHAFHCHELYQGPPVDPDPVRFDDELQAFHDSHGFSGSDEQFHQTLNRIARGRKKT